jgi:hypothetical protein
MVVTKPRVFIGSSSEGLPAARALETQLTDTCEVSLWKTVFAPSDTYIESLEKALETAEFAVLLVTPDDLRTKRDQTDQVPRDNVVFELGMFMGRIGRERVFVAKPRAPSVELPTDLRNLNVVYYDTDRSDQDLKAAVSPAATDLTLAIQKAPRLANISTDEFRERHLADMDAVYDTITSWPVTDVRVTVSATGTDWVWTLLLTLLHWRLNQVPVRVFIPHPTVSSRQLRAEQARRTLLRELGVAVYEGDAVEVNGFFLSGRYPEDDAVIVLPSAQGDGSTQAVQYQGATHAYAIHALHRQFPDVDESAERRLYVPTLVPESVDVVIERIRTGVSQYRGTQIKMEARNVDTDELRLLSRFARSYKYRQIEFLHDAYRKVGVEPFTAMAVGLASGARSIVTPPVVELNDTGPVVIEGTTRAVFCNRSAIKQYACVAVNGVTAELPGRPVDVHDSAIVERSLPHDERTEDADFSLFRQIERAVHPY